MKKYILTIVITAIIFTGIGAFADNLINANQIYYTDSDSNERRLDLVLDDLYDVVGKDILERLNLTSSKVDFKTSYGDKQTRTVTINATKGSYLIIGVASYGIRNSSITASQGATDSPKLNNNTDCTNVTGKYTKAVSSGASNSTKLVLNTMTSIFKCKFTTDTTLTMTTDSWSSTSTESSSLIATTIKLD